MSLGGLGFDVTAEEEIRPPEDRDYREFLSQPRALREEAIRVFIAITRTPAAEGRVLFESDATWKILAAHDHRILLDRLPSGARRVFHFQAGSRNVRVECSPDLVQAGAVECPIRYPADQILMMYLLSGRGLILHAAGMLLGGRAVVLPGASGAGKSTFARLAAATPGWEALSDDRIIVRVPDEIGEVTAWGTPWPGEGRIAANRAGPLKRLLFLHQGDSNATHPLSPREAMTRLLSTVSIPWYDAEALSASLEAVERLVRSVPASVLTFRPDAGAVEAVEGLLAYGADVRNSVMSPRSTAASSGCASRPRRRVRPS